MSRVSFLPRFSSRKGNNSLLTLEKLVSQSRNSPKTHSVIITHVMPTAIGFIEMINQIFPVQLVIAIPYSADLSTLEYLKNKKFNCYLPSSVDDAFTSSGKLVEEILIKNSTPLLVQEVGGYLAGCTERLSSYSHFRGIVEDTNNGHWRYHSAGSHSCPVLSMAQSPLKDIEDTVIGDGVIYSVERIFRDEFDAILQGCRCGIIGYGKIGTSTAIALKGRKCEVATYDIDPSKNIRSRFDGYIIEPFHRLLENCDLIIGCTGKTSINEEDIPFIKNNAILASASAKDEEFDLKAFARVCSLEKINSAVWRYSRKDGSVFYLLNQGTPINFRDRSVLGSLLDMIYSELFVCMRELATVDHPKGLEHSPPHIHSLVAKTWLEIYEDNFHESPQDKIWSFPYSLEHSVPFTFKLQMGALK